MADEQEQQSEAPAKGGMSKMTLIMIAALMLVEGVAVFAVLKITGGPSAAAAELVEDGAVTDETLVEIELLSDRFQNMQSGRVWLWEMQIFLKVKNKNKAHVEATLERRKAEIHEGVALIFRRAEDRHLKEPGLETTTRQLNHYMNEIFGTDPDGMPRVDRVIVPKAKGFPADF